MLRFAMMLTSYSDDLKVKGANNGGAAQPFSFCRFQQTLVLHDVAMAVLVSLGAADQRVQDWMSYSSGRVQ